jgi:hypothetical protein
MQNVEMLPTVEEEARRIDGRSVHIGPSDPAADHTA